MHKHVALFPVRSLPAILQVGLPSLSLGSCSGLSGLELSSSSLARLDLRGCGQLTQLLLDCPTLSVMDATFCSELGDTGLAGAVANAPPLTQLVLSVCCQVGPAGWGALRTWDLFISCAYRRL